MSIPRADRLALAGPCAKCTNFDPVACVYTAECRGCSRYYGDLFTERVHKSPDNGTRREDVHRIPSENIHEEVNRV